MANGSGDEHGFVREVRANTRRYIDGLVAEIESLRAQLESVKQAGSDLINEQDRFFEQYASIESQNDSLASLYVASYRLHGEPRRDEVLRVVQEIVANLIGSEELAVFQRRPGEQVLEPILSSGVDLERLGPVEVGRGAIGGVAASGTPYFAETRESREAQDGPACSEDDLTACVPLKLGDDVTGAVAIFRLLEQKPSLEPLDFELLDLLATQAGSALYAATLHERFSDRSKDA